MEKASEDTEPSPVFLSEDTEPALVFLKLIMLNIFIKMENLFQAQVDVYQNLCEIIEQ